MLSRLALKVLISMITPRTAEYVADLLADVLDDLAAKTETDVDDQVVHILKLLLNASDDDPPPVK